MANADTTHRSKEMDGAKRLGLSFCAGLGNRREMERLMEETLGKHSSKVDNVINKSLPPQP